MLVFIDCTTARSGLDDTTKTPVLVVVLLLVELLLLELLVVYILLEVEWSMVVLYDSY